MTQFTSAMGRISFEEEAAGAYGTDPKSTRDFLGIITSFSHNYTRNPTPYRGVGTRNIRGQVPLGTDVEITMEIQVQNIHWLYMVLGGGSLAAPAESDTLPSFTFEVSLVNMVDTSNVYCGTVINSIDCTIAEDEVITVSVSARAQALYRYDAVQLTHAGADTDIVRAFYDARLYTLGTIGTSGTSETQWDEWVFEGDGSTFKDIYLNHIPKSSPTPEVWVDGGTIPVTLGVVEDPDDATIVAGHVYINTLDGELTFHSDSIPAAAEDVTAYYTFDYEEISAKTKSISFTINNNNTPKRGIGSFVIRNVTPQGRDYTGTCTFYKEDSEQVDWVLKFQDELTLKIALTIVAGTKNLVFSGVGFGTHAESLTEADIVTEDMNWTGVSLAVS